MTSRIEKYALALDTDLPYSGQEHPEAPNGQARNMCTGAARAMMPVIVMKGQGKISGLTIECGALQQKRSFQKRLAQIGSDRAPKQSFDEWHKSSHVLTS